MSQITMLEVGKLTVADDNLRGELGDLSELAGSIKSLGVLEPLLVSDNDGKLLVVAGARRLEAAKKAGAKEVPCIVRPFTDQERVEVMIVENLLREDITPLEEAQGYKRLIELGQTQRQIAARVGRAQSHISKRLMLTELPEPVQKAVGRGQVNLESVQQLSKLKDDPETVLSIVNEAVARQHDGGAESREFANRQVERKVQAQLEAKEKAKLVEASIAKLKKAGEKDIVTLVGDGYSVKTPNGYKQVVVSSYRDDDIEYAPGKHAKLSCHAVGVNPKDGTVVELCSKPSTHKTRAQKAKDQQDKEKKANAAAAAKEKAAIEKRRDFLAGLVSRSIDKGLLLDLVFIALVEHDSWGWEQIALQLLPVTDKDIDDANAEIDEPSGDPMELIEWYAARSQVNRLRATFAIVVGRLESQFRASNEYLELLVKHGYEPNPDEKKRLAKAEKTEEALVA